MMKSILDAILFLVTKTKKHNAPWKTQRHGEWFEFVLPVDDDNVAYLTMPKESYDTIVAMYPTVDFSDCERRG
jgi:hypothetical protein